VTALHVPLSPIALRSTFFMQTCGVGDPTASLDDSALVKTFEAPEGHVRVAVALADGGLDVTWDGDPALFERWRRYLPPDDGYAAFAPAHRLVRELHRSRPGLRIVRVPWLFDVAASAVLQQRVRWRDATRAWRQVALRFGTTGPFGVAFPSARRVARLYPPQLEGCGIDHARARALIALAREHAIHDALALDADLAAVRARLLAVPGIGPWTTEMILGFGYGDPDAVPTGDVHLPHTVCKALAGELRGSDQRMLELLAPFAGQRFRVTRLL
jgi:3-methyladenine DNA glycosylase/8-oxoguanine DNA glycosylase